MMSFVPDNQLDDGPQMMGERLWPDDTTGPYRLRLWQARIAGRPSVVGVELWGCEPAWQPWQLGELLGEHGVKIPPATSITGQAIRGIPLATLLEAWVNFHLRLGRAALRLWPEQPGQAKKVAKYERDFGKPQTSVGRPAIREDVLASWRPCTSMHRERRPRLLRSGGSELTRRSPRNQRRSGAGSVRPQKPGS